MRFWCSSVIQPRLNHRLLPETGDGDGAPLAAAALSAAGPLPAHHPDTLAAALAAGNTGYVSAAVRRALQTEQSGVRLSKMTSRSS